MHSEILPEIIKFSKTRGEVLLSFSGGKDSLLCWCALHQMGIKVHPYYMYYHPDLDFVNEYLDYLEDFFGVKIIRVLHPLMYNWLRTYSGQTPHRRFVVDMLDLPSYTYEDIEAGVRRTLDLPSSWVAIGTRSADSMNRRAVFKKHGWIRAKTKKFYPVYNIKKDALISIINETGVKLAPDYEIFGRSYDGYQFTYLAGMRDRWPDDYAKILEVFPLLKSEMYRAEFAVKHGVSKPYEEERDCHSTSSTKRRKGKSKAQPLRKPGKKKRSTKKL
jgi:hypothetical protein